MDSDTLYLWMTRPQGYAYRHSYRYEYRPGGNSQRFAQDNPCHQKHSRQEQRILTLKICSCYQWHVTLKCCHIRCTLLGTPLAIYAGRYDAPGITGTLATGEKAL